MLRRDGRLQEHDQILAINGQVFDSSITRSEAIHHLQKASGNIELIVARGIPVAQSSPSSSALERSHSERSNASDMVQISWKI